MKRELMSIPKKGIAVLLSIVLIFSMSACGSKKAKKTASADELKSAEAQKRQLKEEGTKKTEKKLHEEETLPPAEDAMQVTATEDAVITTEDGSEITVG